ncbi:hypothetical protein Q7P37_002516 [Cladosporium fusiforme]
MDSALTIGQSVSLSVNCSLDERTSTVEQATYRPGDLIPAYMELFKHRTFESVSLHGSLVGETRVWTSPADREDVFQTMIYTHLNQTNGLSHTLPLLNNASGRDAVIVPITFVLPELVIGSKDTNGRMPPSCEAGSAYVDPWGRVYMQPLIEYYLQVTLRYRLPEETAVRIISAKRRINITTSPHSEPPSYSQSLPEEGPVAVSADVKRSWFSKPFARLDLAMGEPLPVVGHAPGGSCNTMGQLRMTWTTYSNAYDEFELGQRPLKIVYQLRTRTRYGTRAIQEDAQVDERSSDETRPHTRIGIKPLGVLEVRPSDRDDVEVDVSGKQRSHSGVIPIPIHIEQGTLPTFSHLLASRDYTLLVKVKIQGLHHDALSLEVPLQVCESIGVRAGDDVRAKSAEFSDMLLSEVLPRYEDHKHSLTP